MFPYQLKASQSFDRNKTLLSFSFAFLPLQLLERFHILHITNPFCLNF